MSKTETQDEFEPNVVSNDLPGFNEDEEFAQIHGYLRGVEPAKKAGQKMVIYSYRRQEGQSSIGLNVVPESTFDTLPDNLEQYELGEEDDFLKVEEILGYNEGVYTGRTRLIH